MDKVALSAKLKVQAGSVGGVSVNDEAVRALINSGEKSWEAFDDEATSASILSG